MTSQEKYIHFCEKETDIPLFHQPKWLDAVCGGRENWDVVLLTKGNEIVATLPLFYKRKKIAGQPPLTPYLGPYIKFPDGQKHVTKYRYERDLLEELVKLLPDLNSIKMHLLPERKNWLPFYWNGFSETTRYTFRLKDLSNPRLFESMKGSVRRQVKKASKSIRIEFNDDIERFYQINASSFNRQNMEIPYSLDFLKRIDRAVEDQRIILLGRDEKDNVHAGLYITWDRNCAYYLMGGLNPEYQSSGAKSLLFWEAIKYTSSFVSEFDFEGSMICSIENFFSSFGATQVPYHQVYKDNRSVSVKVISCLKRLL